ncbi:hypothetical protein BT63DRAFT_439436 [Microthyrium microscopicum]|uniref:Uncharacterized protein n=1 Tax=Microthyrium microscopicum TaxID=703497 RepID=A0A6A6UDM8_9PEZI|nr:hypothetical protein BT63DRAFT_439436 [Microthyrium microscopicum]
MSSFPLVRFSQATDPEAVTTFSWLHATDDLNCNITAQHVTDYSILSVFQGVNMLDSIPVSDKIKESNAAVDLARNLRIELRHEQLPIGGLYRSTSLTIALRHTTHNNEVHRIQMRFAEAHHYNQALDWMKMQGISLIDSANMTSRPNSGPRPSTTPNAVNMARTPIRKASVPRKVNSRSKSKANSNMLVVPSIAQGMPQSSPAPGISGLRAQTSHEPSAIREPLSEIRSTSVNAMHSYTSARPMTSSATLTTIQEAPENSSPTDTTTIHKQTASPQDYHPSSFAASNSSLSGVPATVPNYENAKFIQPYKTNSTILPPLQELPFKTSSSRPSSSHPAARPVTAVSHSSDFSVQNPSPLRHSSQAADLPTTNPNPTSPMPDVTSISTARTTSPTIVARTSSPTTTAASRNLSMSHPPLPSNALIAQLAAQPSVIANLAGYAALSDEERHRLVEDAIIASIQSDEFVQFCSDFEGTWERIGLSHS